MLPPVSGGRRAVVVGDKYTIAAQLDFHLRGRADVFVLDHPRNRRDGRALQYRVWDADERGLRRRAGEDALVVLEVARGPGRSAAELARVARLFTGLQTLGELAPPRARPPVRFLFLAGRSIRGE
jgi:hypothetical protein